MIRVDKVRKSYGSSLVLDQVEFQVADGELFGIIGPNGSGKSTLVKLLSAVERADAGRILLDGKAAEAYPRKALARWMAVLQQEALPPVGFTVREVVEMGRYPFQNWLGEERASVRKDGSRTGESGGKGGGQRGGLDGEVGGMRGDHVRIGDRGNDDLAGEVGDGGGQRGERGGHVRIGGMAGPSLIDDILERLGLTDLADRPLAHLSGGERQRAALGKTMAQQPRLLLLDEPTTYLDIGHQIQLMDQIKEWQRETGMTVVAVLHDLNLAALYCDRLLLLNHGRVVDIGPPRELLRAELIQEVYGITPVIASHPVSGVPQVILTPQGVSGASAAVSAAAVP